MTKENFALYAELKKQEKAIAEELEALRPLLIAEMQEAKCDKVDSDRGSFTLSVHTKYLFSDALEADRLKLKDREKDEKADGTAKVEETPKLIFVEKK